MSDLAEFCSSRYATYHRPEFLVTDPLSIALEYRDSPDFETAAFICASLALGRVETIRTACRDVLSRFGSISRELPEISLEEIIQKTEGFRYRFFKTPEISSFLFGIGQVLKRYGSLRNGFYSGFSQDDQTLVPALCRFHSKLYRGTGGNCGILLTDPSKNSASKRLHLFLRWMVRRDIIDPGGWDELGASRLIVPLDTHMLQVARALRLTTRKTADLKTAIEVTRLFLKISPDDPVRYDFCLTRPGILKTLNQTNMAACRL